MSSNTYKYQVGGLPLVRLSAANPFLVMLQERGCNAKKLLQSLGLPDQVPASSELFVSLATMYELVESTSSAAGDHTFGFQVGAKLKLAGWEPFARAAAVSATVGEILTNFVINSSEHAATEFSMLIQGGRSTFAINRPIVPKLKPAQNDAFYAGLIRKLLQTACAESFEAKQLLALVCDPTAIPAKSWSGQIAEQDTQGMRITFPTAWMLQPVQTSGHELASRSSVDLPRSLFKDIAVAISPHLQDETLDADRAAELCGYSRRQLSALLRQRGTTISREITALRAQAAIERLTETNQRVSDIGRLVGYTDSAVFARAFKRWTGKTPTEYRRAQKAPD